MSERTGVDERPEEVGIVLTGPYEDADIFRAPCDGLLMAVPQGDGVPPLFIVAGREVTDDMREVIAKILTGVFGSASLAREEVADMVARAASADGRFTLLVPSERLADDGLAFQREAN